MRRCLGMTLVMMGLGSVMAFGLGEEQEGNRPLVETNYAAYPGLAGVMNDRHRVYHTWVNGAEDAYFEGDAGAVNGAMAAFAGVKAKRHEVLVVPWTGTVGMFEGQKRKGFDWQVHWQGGISGFLVTLDQGEKVWSAEPVMVVHVGEEVALEKLVVPAGVEVVGPRTKAKRMREGLKSKEKDVRGYGALELARVDPTDAESAKAVVGLLKDEDGWVRDCAVRAVGMFGVLGQEAVPRLKEMEAGAKEMDKEEIRRVIREVTPVSGQEGVREEKGVEGWCKGKATRN